MASWSKVRNLFWQSGEPSTEGSADEMSDEELAAFLADSPHGVSEDGFATAASVDLGQVKVENHAGQVRIDFQAQYDDAGIPDTDEVERLEDFLTRLDPALPQASKVAAAEAFLGAIGKARDHVLADAERKIQQVRGMLKAKQDLTAGAIQAEHSAISELERQIETHKQQILSAQAELEGFRHACVVEEARLQAARVFFGNAGMPTRDGGTR